MSAQEDDLRSELETLKKEVKVLKKELAELREFSKYLYIMLTEEGDYEPIDPPGSDFGKMNT